MRYIDVCVCHYVNLPIAITSSSVSKLYPIEPVLTWITIAPPIILVIEANADGTYWPLTYIVKLLIVVAGNCDPVGGFNNEAPVNVNWFGIVTISAFNGLLVFKYIKSPSAAALNIVL